MGPLKLIQVLWPMPLRIITIQIQNSILLSYRFNELITTKMSTLYVSCAVIVYTKICTNIIVRNRITLKQNSHEIWIVKGFSKMGPWTRLLPCLLSWIRPEAQQCVIDKAAWFNVVSIIMCHNYSEAGLQCKSYNTPRGEQQINFVTLTLAFSMTYWISATYVFIAYIYLNYKKKIWKF